MDYSCDEVLLCEMTKGHNIETSLILKVIKHVPFKNKTQNLLMNITLSNYDYALKIDPLLPRSYAHAMFNNITSNTVCLRTSFSL